MDTIITVRNSLGSTHTWIQFLLHNSLKMNALFPLSKSVAPVRI